MSLAKIERKIQRIEKFFPKARKRIDWQPQSIPQSMAYHCPADELLYGGAPGGGKSDLIIGLALTAHGRSLILRREAMQLEEVIARITDLTDKNINVRDSRFKIGDRVIQLGGCKLIRDKTRWKGRAHDLKAWDELSEFAEEIYTFVNTWNRSTDPAQRCRIVATTNPPDNQIGAWIIKRFAPWLKPNHPKPAQSGEIRWFIGNEEVDTSEPVVIKGKIIYPRSRSFIRARVEDNLSLMAAGYDRLLDNLPPELRYMADGDFAAATKDHPQQVIPLDWVNQAVQRGKYALNELQAIDAIACDPSRGGIDPTVIALRRADRLEIFKYPAIVSQDGMQVVNHIVRHRGNGNPITMVDIIGIGSSPYDLLKLHGIEAIAMNASQKSYRRDRANKFGFSNLRAEWWWLFREMLDPQYSPTICLPDDSEMIAELTAPRWSLTLRGILIESKEEIAKRLGRSTNIADAIIMCCNLPAIYSSSFA
jgi:hypothetical protein